MGLNKHTMKKIISYLPGECYKNDNVNTYLSSDESHSADSTWRTVSWDTVNMPSWSQYGVDTTSGIVTGKQIGRAHV